MSNVHDPTIAMYQYTCNHVHVHVHVDVVTQIVQVM